jgi:hypothetical protein
MGSELFRERRKLLFGCFELELQLSRVDPLRFGDEDALPQELELTWASAILYCVVAKAEAMGAS